MKKVLSVFLAMAMIFSLITAAGVSASAAKALPEGVLYYWGFENDSDLTAVEHMVKYENSDNRNAKYEIIPANRRAVIAEGQGAVGNALYLDGTYGVKLNDLEKIDRDCYSVSFWMSANPIAEFGPAVQLGANMGGNIHLGPTTQMDFMLCSWDEADAEVFPNVETFRSDVGAVEFPGFLTRMTADQTAPYTVGEWKMITLVVDGEKFHGEDYEDHIGTKLYVNGKLAVDATAATGSAGAVLPGLLSADNMEGFVGINYNDECFKGYVDELYIFGKALDEEAVQKLFKEGNPPKTSVPTEAPKALPEITKDPTSESVQEGGNAYFVARANNYNYINWYIVSADHTVRIPVNTAPWNFAGLSVSGEGTTTLLLANCPMSLNGWCVEACFTGDGGTATTNHCFVNVIKAPKAQLIASPSSGYFEYNDQTVTLTAAPGDEIYYELRTDSSFFSGTVMSGEVIYIPAIPDMRYDAYLYAYVVGDQGNAISCQYTMDCLPDYPEPTIPDFNGGTFTNGEVEITLTPIGNNTFLADVAIFRLCDMNGYGSYYGGSTWLNLTAPDGSTMTGTFADGVLWITTSTWELLPEGSVFNDIQ